MRNRLFIIFFITTMFHSLEAQVVEDYLLLTTADSESPPLVMDTKILFRVKPDTPTYRVSVVFKTENYVKQYPLHKNAFGIFTGFVPIPNTVKENKLVYKFIINGLWGLDSSNTNIIKDYNDSASYLVLSGKVYDSHLISPKISQDNTVSFRYQGASKQKIHLIGDFNHWDPYMNEMQEIEPGLYEISFRLPPGEYLYQIRINEDSIADPLNKNWVWSDNQTSYSTFKIPSI